MKKKKDGRRNWFIFSNLTVWASISHLIFSCPYTRISTIGFLIPKFSDSDSITPLVFLGFQLEKSQFMELLRLCESISYNIFLYWFCFFGELCLIQHSMILYHWNTVYFLVCVCLFFLLCFSLNSFVISPSYWIFFNNF